jgi:hypothetical protein
MHLWVKLSAFKFKQYVISMLLGFGGTPCTCMIPYYTNKNAGRCVVEWFFNAGFYCVQIFNYDYKF